MTNPIRKIWILIHNLGYCHVNVTEINNSAKMYQNALFPDQKIRPSSKLTHCGFQLLLANTTSLLNGMKIWHLSLMSAQAWWFMRSHIAIVRSCAVSKLQQNKHQQPLSIVEWGIYYYFQFRFHRRLTWTDHWLQTFSRRGHRVDLEQSAPSWTDASRHNNQLIKVINGKKNN